MALPPPSPTSTCLVTGASSGIGADIARELARRGHGVTLAARREDRLRSLADELSATGVRAEAVACDVTDPGSREAMARTIDERGLDVEVLVNNAGFGSGGLFQDLDPETEVRMVRTNCEAVVALCGHYVKGMVARGRGAILNVASTAGYQPLPRQSTYSASKAFALTFSMALGEDLAGTGVSVTALCPGPVPTEFGETAAIDEELFSLPSFVMRTSEQVAEAAIRGLDEGRRTVVPGLANVAGTIVGQYTPRSLVLPLMRRLYPVGK